MLKDPPEDIEAMVNDHDQMPTARHTVLPTPPMPSLDDAEEEEEEEEEEVEEEDEEEEEKVVIPVTPLTDEETSLMMKAFINEFSTSNVVLPNPALTDKLISVIKRKFKDGAVTLSLKDPGANMRKKTNGIAFVTTWVRSGNELVTLDPDDMGPNANLTRSQVLAASYRKYGVGGDKTRVCLSYAIAGLITMAYLDIDKPSPPPLILDLVPAHTQTEFNKKSGSACIDASNTDVAELMMVHILKSCSCAFIKG